MMLESIENGPLVYPTIEENGKIHEKKYVELAEQEKLQDNYDVQENNIVLQGLLPDVYSLVNHCKAAKDLWYRVKLLMQDIELSYQERECILYNEFDKFTSVKGDDLIACLDKVMKFMSTVMASRFPLTNNQLRTYSNLRNQATIQDDRVTVQKTDDLDAYNSDCDDISLGKAVLMAKLSSYDLDVLSECVLDFVNDMNVRSKSKSAKSSKKKNIWKLTSKVFTQAVMIACFTQNQTLIHKRHNKTSYELLYDRKPDLFYLYVFGTLCYPTNDNEDLRKLKPKSDIEIIIGYALAKKAYRIYKKRTHLIIETIHVDFDELTTMTSEQFSLAHGPQILTPRTVSLGLMLNPLSPTPYVPPTKKK
uniref:Retrovirus-related Pol polyprotein from transposon TNT 1-94 n=1 Tax=Tanacetum cinerariifolium TaxID=118510 RepID=A0A6L2MMX4_TANCI|nr:retrovirus-related Pol polyprotein from transposon TNT 1-94 [Tanacetum cinerariifolium]